MDNFSTPTPHKTPLRRLGLVRSVRKINSEEPAKTTPALFSTSSEERSPAPDDISTPSRLRPIKSTCSADSSSDIEENNTDSSVTPVQVRCGLKRTRLSLSQNWKNKIVHKKQLNLKRRKLIDEVESCPEVCDPNPKQDVSTVETTALVTKSTTQQRIQDLRENISVWREGCIEALNDLQERRGVGDMESLLSMLQIPHAIVNFDSANQVFLDPG